MSESEQNEIGTEESQPIKEDPVRALLEEWGLRAGRTAGGWKLDEVSLDIHSAAACIDFSREENTVRVRAKPAGEEPCFDTVGAIAISHDSVDESLNQEVGNLLRLLIEWFKQRADNDALAALLTSVETQREEAESTAQAEPEPDPQPETQEFEVHLEQTGGPSPEEMATGSQPYIVVHDPPPLDPAMRAPDNAPVIGFEFIDVEDLHKYPDALREIYNGTRGGLVVRGVYSKEDMARVVERLEPGQEKFPTMQLPAAQNSYFLGLCLEGGDPTLKDYLNSAERFRAETLSMFEGMEAFESRVEKVFSSLAGGRDIKLAHYSDGRPYTPATIRILPDGGQLAPHCGNEMYNRPSYEHLNTFMDDHDQLSYFLTLQEAEEGGGLIIYNLLWSDVGQDHILPDQRSNVGQLLADAQWMEVRPSAGDVLIFDGGRWLHRVDWVKGRTRWTMGGFLMFNRPGDTVLYFA
jgi:hypothetical protein